MSATNSTPNYQLPIFLPTDKPAWLVDFNGAMNKIDSGIADAKTTGSSAQSTAESAITQVSGVKTTADTALANAGKAQETADSAITLANNATSVANAAQSTANDAITATDKFKDLGVWFHYNKSMNEVTINSQITRSTVQTPASVLTLDYNPILKLLSLNYNLSFDSINLAGNFITTPDGYLFLPIMSLPMSVTGYKSITGSVTYFYMQNVEGGTGKVLTPGYRRVAIMTYNGNAWFGFISQPTSSFTLGIGNLLSAVIFNTSELGTITLNGWTNDGAIPSEKTNLTAWYVD